MTTCRIHLVGAVTCALLAAGHIPSVSAFKLDAHETINDRAATVSGADAYLKKELALKDGLATIFVGKSGDEWRGLRWIRFGGRAEDLYDESEWFGAAYRSKNHFHNPIVASWAESGLRTLSICLAFVISGESSPRWAQDPNQGQSGQASWADARRAYFGALTLGPSADRDDAWARTFQILGQQMHLVADLAVPAHTRNDIHCPVSDRFELWARRSPAKVDSILSATVQPVDPSIFSIKVPFDDQMAKVPIARLMDTDQYDGTNPTDTMRLTVGLAEYTNANFFSDHTVFEDHRWGDPSFRYPSFASVELGNEEDGPGGVRRRYFLKTQDGDTGYRLAVPSALYESLPDSLRDQEKALDDKVLEDYAGRLLPKAVGYSAALLDYFFRGKLEAMIGADPADSEKLQLTAKNASSEPLGGGTLAVYGDYDGGQRRPHGSWPIQGPVAPGGDLPSQSFSPDKPSPKRYMVVYQGDLGEEKKDNPPGFGGAVIGKATKYEGVIEELILFRTPNNTYDVYFRNANQVVLLGLSENLPVVQSPGRPAEVHWGVDSNHFFVKNYEIRTVANTQIAVPVYWIYKINRPDNSVSGDEPVQVELAKMIQPPATPLPYGYREVWINAPESNRSGEMVYPYGMVFAAPYAGVEGAGLSEQEVLSEDLGSGRGLEIYALFQAWVSERIEYIEQGGGSGQADLWVNVIIQVSTGAIVYEDPISGFYKPEVAATVSRGSHAEAFFWARPQTWIVSWSDRDVTKRRWVTQIQVDDFYRTYDWTPDDGKSNRANHRVENSVQTVLIENGQPKFYITPKQTYVEYDPYEERDLVEIFFPSALVPTMSSEKWLWVDEPDSFLDTEILRRTQYLMSSETGMKHRVGEWTPLESTQYVIAPKIREMVMLQPGFMYAHGEPVYAIPQLFGYESSTSPLAQDLTSDAEKQKFVGFLAPDGLVDPAFTTSAPLLEDADVRGKGRVRTDSYPPGFQAVLDTLLNPYSETQIAWHVVPDADLVPARRR